MAFELKPNLRHFYFMLSQTPHKKKQTQRTIFMAVEARRMNLFPSSQFISNNRDFIKQNQAVLDICCNDNQMTTTGGLLPYAAVGTLKSPPETVDFPVYQSESGLTSRTAPGRKRTRRSVYDEPPAGQFRQNWLDQQIINSHVQNHHSEIDRFIAIHTEKVRMEMEERKKRQSRMLVTAIEERVMKKLKEKDEEIERMGKLNWILQERVKRLCVENQLWRELAETNEATVNSLRTDLEQVLIMAGAGEVAAAPAAEDDDDDAESCCGSTSDSGREEEMGGDGRCRKCGRAEARVLVLPCRHLCLCTMCGSALHTCPVCNSDINATVHVNFS